MSSLAPPPTSAWFAALQQPTRLQQSLALALLLHVWLVLLIGNTPGGSARPGEGLWGRLNVTLELAAGTQGESAGTATLPAVPNQGAVGQAKRERFGGTVRTEAETAAAPDTPGAAKLGMWNEQAAELQRSAAAPAERVPALPPARLAELAPVATTPPKAPEPPPPVLRNTAEPAALLQRPAAEPAETGLAALRPPAAPEALPRFVAPAVPELPATVLKRSTEAPPALARSPVPAAQLASPPRSAAAEALPRFEPPRLPELPATVSKTTPDLAPQIARPPATSGELRPTTRVATPEAMPRFEAPELQTPSIVTKTTAEAAPQLQRRAAAAAQAQAQALRPESSATAQSLPRFDAPPANLPANLPERAAGVEATPGAAASTQASGQPREAAATLGAGAPDAGSRLGQDVATAPSTPASAPKLDLEWRRPRGGEISRQGSSGVLQLLAHPPEQKKSKLGESLENAAKKDCREAYAGAGLLAAVPLLLDAARDKGCRW